MVSSTIKGKDKVDSVIKTIVSISGYRINLTTHTPVIRNESASCVVKGICCIRSIQCPLRWKGHMR